MEETQQTLEERTRERIRKNGFMIHNHIELESVEKDRAVFRLDIRSESCNPYGMVHGGAIYTMAGPGHRLGAAPGQIHGAHGGGHHRRGREAAGHGGVHLLLRGQGPDGPEGRRGAGIRKGEGPLPFFLPIVENCPVISGGGTA